MALRELNARIRIAGEPQGVPFDHSGETLSRSDLEPRDGPRRPRYHLRAERHEGYDDLIRDARRISCAGSRCRWRRSPMSSARRRRPVARRTGRSCRAPAAPRGDGALALARIARAAGGRLKGPDVPRRRSRVSASDALHAPPAATGPSRCAPPTDDLREVALERVTRGSPTRCQRASRPVLSAALSRRHTDARRTRRRPRALRYTAPTRNPLVRTDIHATSAADRMGWRRLAHPRPLARAG